LIKEGMMLLDPVRLDKILSSRKQIIKLEFLIPGRLYAVRARNFHVGVYVSSLPAWNNYPGFLGPRYDFDDPPYLSPEQAEAYMDLQIATPEGMELTVRNDNLLSFLVTYDDEVTDALHAQLEVQRNNNCV
jgi:hypothetical protein